MSCGLRCLRVNGWEFSYVGRWACHDSYTALGLHQKPPTCVLKMGKAHCTWIASQEGCCYYLTCQKCPGQQQSRGKQDPGNHQIWPSGENGKDNNYRGLLPYQGKSHGEGNVFEPVTTGVEIHHLTWTEGQSGSADQKPSLASVVPLLLDTKAILC